MNMEPWPSPPGTLSAGSITREQAAQLLKLARGGSGEVVAEAADWANAAMPDRAGVLRLKVRSLLRTGHFEAADALLAQALLIYPNDAVLSTLRAERLLTRGRLESAAREIELVIARHPHRPSALALGAEIAGRCGDRARAIALLEQAAQARPFDAVLRTKLVEALLADHQAVQAAQQMAHVHDPPALLEARVLRAQGRTIDALARLQGEWNAMPEGERADELAVAIVETLEEIGRPAELERFIDELSAAQPGAIGRAAQVWLALGRFDDAMKLGAQLLRRRAFVPIGRGIVLVAATMKGNFGIARRVVRQLISSELTIDRISLADLWRRGIVGRLICKHTALGSATTTGSQSVLATMAQSAADLFREQLVEAEANADPAAATELLHLVRQCTLPPRAERILEEAHRPADETQHRARQEAEIAKRLAA